jgi:hypothetical protein
MKVNRIMIVAVFALAGLAVTAFAFPWSGGAAAQNPCSGFSALSGLTPEEEAHLVYMREEEKLARDVYLTLYSVWNVPIFSNIAQSEQRHMDALKRMIDKYNVTDPIVSNDVGVFSNPLFTKLYKLLVRVGSKSPAWGYMVGVAIEKLDIKDLEDALAETTKQDLTNVYTNLMAGSYNHLAAFLAQLGM